MLYQQTVYRGDGTKSKGVPLPLILTHVERVFPDLVVDKARWGTHDGYIPYRALWWYWRAIPAVRAMECQMIARAMLLSRAGESVRMEEAKKLIREAMGHAS